MDTAIYARFAQSGASTADSVSRWEKERSAHPPFVLRGRTSARRGQAHAQEEGYG